MRHRYIVLLAAVLAIAALAIMAGQVTGEKTVAPATQGGQGQQTQQAPQAQQPAGQQPAPAAGRGFGASAMPMASSPAVKMPAATTKPTMGPTTAATMKPGATMAPTAKVTPAATGRAGGERVGTGTGVGVGPGARAGGGAYFAQVTSYGLVTETINPGGVLTGYMVIQNNGNDVINDALVNIVVAQAGAAGTTITSRDQTLSNLNIAPGDQKRVEFSVNVPNSVTPGSYDVRATVQANGQQIDTFTKTVTVS